MAPTDSTTGSVVCQPPTRAVTLRRILLGALLPALVSGTSLAQLAGAPNRPDGPPGQRVYELRNGRWFDGRGFAERTMYTQYGVFVDTPTAAVDSVIDLRGRWMVPPYGEAHNHNVEAGPDFEDRVRRYLSHGVFYVKNPNVLPSGVFPIRDDVNQPGSIDVAFASAASPHREVIRWAWSGGTCDGASGPRPRARAGSTTRSRTSTTWRGRGRPSSPTGPTS